MLAGVVVLSAIGVAQTRAVDPTRLMSQYVTTRWGVEQGFPGGAVHAIAQTSDGYLWIGAERGLVRFDGISFRLFELSGESAGSGPTVLGLVADAEGTLWIRLRGPALVRYRAGTFEQVRLGLATPTPVITAMQGSRDGAVLLAPLGGAAVVHRAGTTTPITDESVSRSFIIAIADSDNGTIWLGTRDAGLLRVEGHSAISLSEGLPDSKVNHLLSGDNGVMWIGTDRGLARWDGARIRPVVLAGLDNRMTVLAMTRDRDSNIWVAAGAAGVLRINAQGVSTFDRWDARLSGSVTAVFEDRDGNVWIGTTRGIERVRDGIFTTYSSTTGLPDMAVGPLLAQGERVWFAPVDGGLYGLEPGTRRPYIRVPIDDVVYSIAGDSEDLWVGTQRSGLVHLRPHEVQPLARRLTTADGLAQNNVYTVLRTRAGDIWAGTLSAGASRYRDGRFTTYTTADGLASNTVTTMIEASNGAVWFGTPGGISTMSGGTWTRTTTQGGLPSNDVNTLLEDSSGQIWVGTARGLAVIREHRVQRVNEMPETLRSSILGLAEDGLGWLWVTTGDRVMRLDRQRFVEGGDLLHAVREFDLADGLVSSEGVKRHRSVVADSRGRIWLSTARSISMADPGRAAGLTASAIPHIETLAADGSPIDLLGEPVSIGPRPQRVTLTFAGLSLGVPERVRFRYRLDGFDREWSSPVALRQAAYTNLPPRQYRFRVTASNSEGLWNGPETSLTFVIRPAYWQTAWFQAGLLLCTGLAGWTLYRLRLLQVRRQLTLRFDERLAERTRIAQDLHDTLLQGFVSASMQLHVAAERVPHDLPARAALARVVALMGQVVEEGRYAVRGLRSPNATARGLERAVCDLSGELGVERGEETFKVIVEGAPRPIRPLIRDEAYLVIREAVLNAFRHAAATHIEVQIDYAPRHLRVLVRDDGCGVSADVLQAGRDGHWGLPGMRERAERMRAQLRLWSRIAAGTEVELVVPGDIAYDPMHLNARPWWHNLFRRRRSTAPSSTDSGGHV